MEKLPAQMTVVGISKPGGPEVLVPETRALPVPGPGEILVKVLAAGVNRPDVAQRSGAYPPPPGASDLPGLEIAGEVVALGAGSVRHKLGDKVMSLVAGGGYAQYCIAQDAQAMAVPPALSMQEAGAIPETLMTVWHNVFERGALKPGETLLIHGGSSGIGTMAIQLAKALGSRVIVTVGSKDKADACIKLGADLAINYKTEDFVEATKKATDGAGANVILDMVGGDYIDRNYDAAAIDGRIVQIAFLSGTPKATVNFQGDGEAARSHRLDAAPPQQCGQGGDGGRDRGQGDAAAARRTRQTGHGQHIPAGKGRRRPSAHGDQRTYWQNCVGGLTLLRDAQPETL